MKYSLWNLMIVALAGPPLLAGAHTSVFRLSESGPFTIVACLVVCAVLLDRPRYGPR
jgi:hypothetical protein